MNPKEKAEDLLCQLHGVNITKEECKIQALICVNEIIKALKYPPEPNKYRQVIHITVLNYWADVKQEIIKYE